MFKTYATAANAKRAAKSAAAKLDAEIIVADLTTEKTADGLRVLLERTTELTPGRLHVIGDVQSRSAVADFEVEIAQGAAIANPRTVDVRTGAMVAIRPQLA